MGLANPHFEESYARIFGDGIGMDESADDFFRAFYQRFLSQPTIADLFEHTDHDRQVRMLKKSVYQLVTYYVARESNAELDRLAAAHHSMGIAANAFDIWLEALLATVEEFDPQWDQTTRLAWCWALSPGMTYMSLKPSIDFEQSPTVE